LVYLTDDRGANIMAIHKTLNSYRDCAESL